MSRSITGLPDNDMDYATVCGNHDERDAEDRGRELDAAEMSAELHRVFDRIRGIEQSAHRCEHGVNLEKASCGQCMRNDEQMGADLAARFNQE